MQSQILDAHTAQHPTNRPLLQSKSRPAKAAVRFVVAGAVFLAISFTTLGKFRAEFQETFGEVPACHVVAPDRAA